MGTRELSTAGRVAARIGAGATILGLLGAAAATVDWTAARRVGRSEAVYPISVREYRADYRPTDLEKLPSDTNLLLYVERQFFPLWHPP